MSYQNRYQKKREELFDPEDDERALEKEKAAQRLGRTAAAMQMLIDGSDYPEIAANLGYGTADAAAADVHQALEEEFLKNSQMSSEVLRMIQLKRLDAMHNALLPGISRGNSRAVDVAVKISDRIAKLSGLDAPLKTETVEIHMVDAEITRLKREIAEKKAQLEIEAPVIDAELAE